mgnify:CR=1 FL=1
MNERVCRHALVMPSSTGCPVRRLACPRLDRARWRPRGRSGRPARPEDSRSSPASVDLDLLQHLPDDHLDMLVVDRHALQPVDLLDLVDEVVGQLLDALDRQDVVRRRIAVER